MLWFIEGFVFGVLIEFLFILWFVDKKLRKLKYRLEKEV